MRRVAHGTVWFSPEVEPQILHLMKLQCSATRSAYQAQHKQGLTNNDVKIYVKQNYMDDLNQRYVADACSRASGITQEGAIFGGKKEWKKLQAGKITKEDWQAKRNNQLYSRGDRLVKGNPNIRVDGDRLLINDPKGKWLEGKLFLPSKWNPDWACYGVRVLHRKDKFEVKISWEEEAVPVVTSPKRGIFAIDTNPNGLGVAILDHDGNLLKHEFKMEQRIPFASTNKRDNDVRLLAKSVVEEALSLGIPIALERLEFSTKKRPRGFKKFRRMKSNFVYRKIIEAIQSRAARSGVEVVDPQPAFTSILGSLLYEQMYSLNRHTAASMVIGRRALGIKERHNFTVTGIWKVKKARKPKPKSKTVTTVTTDKTVTSEGESGVYLTLEGRGKTHTLSLKAYSWLQNQFLKSKNSYPHRIPTDSCEKESPETIVSSGKGGSLGEIPKSESFPITGRERQDQSSNNEIDLFLGDETAPLEKLGKLL